MIVTKGLTKYYGSLAALVNLNLHIEAGDIFGFIGPNGAGKTTTMRILATLLEPSSGTALIDGKDVTAEGEAVRRVVGYMPDFMGVYDDLKVFEYLEFFAAAFGVPRSRRKPIVEGVLELTDLRSKRAAQVNSLSRGMQQRLQLARVLIHDPKVLILDEPAAGLDPRARIELRELLKELARMGKTIFISSHILTELSDICTTVGIIVGMGVTDGPVSPSPSLPIPPSSSCSCSCRWAVNHSTKSVHVQPLDGVQSSPFSQSWRVRAERTPMVICPFHRAKSNRST